MIEEWQAFGHSIKLISIVPHRKPAPNEVRFYSDEKSAWKRAEKFGGTHYAMRGTEEVRVINHGIAQDGKPVIFGYVRKVPMPQCSYGWLVTVEVDGVEQSTFCKHRPEPHHILETIAAEFSPLT